MSVPMKCVFTFGFFLIILGSLLMAVFFSEQLPWVIYVRNYKPAICTIVSGGYISQESCCDRRTPTEMSPCELKYPCIQIKVNYKFSGDSEVIPNGTLFEDYKTIYYQTIVGRCSIYECMRTYVKSKESTAAYLSLNGQLGISTDCWADPMYRGRTIRNIYNRGQVIEIIIVSLLIIIVGCIITALACIKDHTGDFGFAIIDRNMSHLGFTKPIVKLDGSALVDNSTNNGLTKDNKMPSVEVGSNADTHKHKKKSKHRSRNKEMTIVDVGETIQTSLLKPTSPASGGSTITTEGHSEDTGAEHSSHRKHKKRHKKKVTVNDLHLESVIEPTTEV